MRFHSIKSISRPVEIGLGFIGTWPGSRYEMLSRIVWTIMMATTQVVQYRYIRTHLNMEYLADLVDSVSTTLPYSLLLFKLVSLWSNYGIVKNILTSMSDDWSTPLNAKLNKDIMISKADLSDRFSKLVIAVYFGAVLLYTGAFVELIRNVEVDNFNLKSRQLLIKMELPLACFESPLYEWVIFLQFLQLLAIAVTIGVLDALVITLILHIGGQIEMAHQALEKIVKNAREHGLSQRNAKFLINRHYRIIMLSKHVETLFSWIALMQFFCNTLVICCIGFIMIIALHDEQNVKAMIKMVLFYLSIMLEAFVFCFAGEYLSHKSKSTSDAAYESLWYLLEPKDSRIVILLILRSQKRLTISAGKFMDLSLESFASMLKASASYVSVLYAMY